MAQEDIEIISGHLRSSPVTEKVRVALGYEKDDERGKVEVAMYVSTIMMELARSWEEANSGHNYDERKDLTVCSTESIIQAMIDAATFRLPIDARKLAYLVKYGSRASFQPGYKGFLYKLGEMLTGVNFSSEIVFADDKLSTMDDSGFQGYVLAKANPFEDDVQKMIGVVACLEWTDGPGLARRKTAYLSKAEIGKIRKIAKQDFIWSAWFLEKAKVAALKRLCKIHFPGALALQRLIDYDNREHFDMTRGVDEVTPDNPKERLTAMLPPPSDTPMQPVVIDVQTAQPEKVATKKTGEQSRKPEATKE